MINDELYNLFRFHGSVYRKDDTEGKILHNIFFEDCVKYMQKYIGTEYGGYTVDEIGQTYARGIHIIYIDPFNRTYYTLL